MSTEILYMHTLPGVCILAMTNILIHSPINDFTSLGNWATRGRVFSTLVVILSQLFLM